MRQEKTDGLILVVCGWVLGLALAACSGESSQVPGVLITPINPNSTATAATIDPIQSQSPGASGSVTVTPNGIGGSELSGFVFPIVDGCLPNGDQLMPNAPRTYRNGIHEGIDLYESDNCVLITLGTHVVAAKLGRVIRADLDYVDPTAAEIAQYLADPTTEASVDKFRGRQIWIVHDDAGQVVTRYAHLSGIAPGIGVGSIVSGGQLIAFVGESGTPESVSNPGHEYHLHFEVRVGASYVGFDQAPEQVRVIYQALFSP